MAPKTTVVVNGQQPQADMLTQFLSNLGLPALIVSTVFPGLIRTVQKYPRLARVITIPLVLWLASNFLLSKLLNLWRGLMTNAMSSVTISSDDFYLFTAFKSWLSKQRMMMLEKAISAQSVFYLRNKGQDGRTIEKELSNNKSIVFDPQNKFQLFRHGARFFLLTMDTKQMLHLPTDRTEMKIWCLGLSPKPIEDLLLHIYDASRTQESRTLTTIMTPYGGRQWNRRCIKPARPLSSVYLDHAEKDRLVADIKEYLAPTTAKWYQSRGIPYRRGYLFHGSPGCGKSSLALALAGHFKLDVYMVSLLDIEISDSALLQLFQAVRSGVLVLLEDVDSAGLGREVAEVSDTATPSTNAAIALRKKAREGGSRITLSGLLNAIDGAGAPEGHVLVMTTNTPDALDEALVRPGRIDVKVQFSKAIRSQIKDIFFNMYQPTPEFDEVKPKKRKAPAKEVVEEESEEEKAEKARRETKRKEEEKVLQEMADQFADNVPERQFSPAQLQDYILLRKDQPKRAVEEIAAWVAKELSALALAASKNTAPTSQRQEDNGDLEEEAEKDQTSTKKTKGIKGKKPKQKAVKSTITQPNVQDVTEEQVKQPKSTQTDGASKSKTKKEHKGSEGHSRGSSADQSPSGSASENGSDDESPATSVGGDDVGAEAEAEANVDVDVQTVDKAKGDGAENSKTDKGKTAENDAAAGEEKTQTAE